MNKKTAIKPSGSLPLLVAFEDKDRVKALGARWDKEEKAWFWPANFPREDVNPWLPHIHRSDLISPYLLPGMIPENMWGVNLRALLAREQWNMLRKECYRLAGSRCRICGKKEKTPHCDEQWVFETKKSAYVDTATRTQRLAQLMCLCEDCHMARHPGYAGVIGRTDEVAAHLATINRWPLSEARKAIALTFRTCQEQGRHKWLLDITHIEAQIGLKCRVPVQLIRDVNAAFMEKLQEEA